MNCPKSSEFYVIAAVFERYRLLLKQGNDMDVREIAALRLFLKSNPLNVDLL